MKLCHFGLFDIESYDDCIYSLLAQRRIQSLSNWEYEPIAPVGFDASHSKHPINSIKSLTQKPCQIDACLLGGGNIIQHARSNAEHYMQEFNGTLAYADLWLGATTLAPQRAPVLWNAPCVPDAFPIPLESLLREALERCAYISVCDKISRENLLRSAPDATIAVVPDACWETSAHFPKSALVNRYNNLLRQHEVKTNMNTVVFHVDSASLTKESNTTIAASLDHIAASLNAAPIIIPLTRSKGTYNTCYNIASLMSSPSIVVEDILETTDILAYLSHCSAYIGSSIQGFITACAYDVPAICINDENNNILQGIKTLLDTNEFISPNWHLAQKHLKKVFAAKHRTAVSQCKERALIELDKHWQRIHKELNCVTGSTEKNHSDHTHAINTFYNSRLHIISSTNDQLQKTNIAYSSSMAWLLALRLLRITNRFPRLIKFMRRYILGITPPERPACQLKQRTPLDFKAQVKQYNEAKKSDRKIVVYTANIGGYDTLMPPETLDPDIDYICFTDAPLNDHGIWQLRPPPVIIENDSISTARYPKLNPHKLFPHYETVVWIDSNVRFRCDVKKHIQTVVNNNADVGFVIHKDRDCAYKEAIACKVVKKVHISTVNKQMQRYKKAGYPAAAGLIESNFYIARIQNPNTPLFFDTWWAELNQYSKRDQLSVGFARHQSSIKMTNLFPEGITCHNHPDFEVFYHNKD